jgi:hypothetical protein
LDIQVSGLELRALANLACPRGFPDQQDILVRLANGHFDSDAEHQPPLSSMNIPRKDASQTSPFTHNVRSPAIIRVNVYAP